MIVFTLNYSCITTLSNPQNCQNEQKLCFGSNDLVR